MDEMTLAVVGIDFPNPDKAGSSRRFELLLCRPGDPVTLRPEPGNRHDRHAIAVLSERGVQVGYLTAERAPWIGARLRRGEAPVAIFQAMGDTAAFVRVRFDGGAPTLPAAGERAGTMPAGEGEGFHPDPDGPEWGA